ncbi:MAG: DUF86 domain-containing protein [Alphaproteobacteria bacterium]|nr:DUF86 domain-containing protein [Alphaproteobacteria bacterium]
MNGLRNRLVHGFWLIDLHMVLRIAQGDTAALASAIERLIETIE